MIKRFIITTITLLQVFLFIGCGQTTNIPKQSSATPQQLSQTFVHNQTTYHYNASSESTSNHKTLSIINSQTGDILQTIVYNSEHKYTKETAYFLDINFDNYSDLLIPISRSAYAGYCEAYIWNTNEEKFFKIENFSKIPNIAVDYQEQCLYSASSGDHLVNYAIYQYNESSQSFEERNALYWESIGKGTTKLIEKKFNKTIAELIIQEADFSYSLNSSDSRFSKYFDDKSFWNIDDKKWTSLLIPELS